MEATPYECQVFPTFHKGRVLGDIGENFKMRFRIWKAVVKVCCPLTSDYKLDSENISNKWRWISIVGQDLRCCRSGNLVRIHLKWFTVNFLASFLDQHRIKLRIGTIGWSKASEDRSSGRDWRWRGPGNMLRVAQTIQKHLKCVSCETRILYQFLISLAWRIFTLGRRCFLLGKQIKCLNRNTFWITQSSL